MVDRTKRLVERLEAQPELRERIEAILAIAENEDQSYGTADEAEQKAIEELQKLGNEVLHGWERRRSEESSSRIDQEGKGVKHEKKSLLAHSVRNNRGRRTGLPGRSVHRSLILRASPGQDAWIFEPLTATGD
jgi:hypothetical protein